MARTSTDLSGRWIGSDVQTVFDMFISQAVMFGVGEASHSVMYGVNTFRDLFFRHRKPAHGGLSLFRFEGPQAVTFDPQWRRFGLGHIARHKSRHFLYPSTKSPSSMRRARLFSADDQEEEQPIELENPIHPRQRDSLRSRAEHRQTDAA